MLFFYIPQQETGLPTRCTGSLNLYYEYEDIQELYTAYWYLQLDLNDIKQRVSQQQWAGQMGVFHSRPPFSEQ